jgi:hypothetical protein
MKPGRAGPRLAACAVLLAGAGTAFSVFAAGSSTAGERDAAELALGWLPPALRAGLQLEVRPDPRCASADPFAGLTVDARARRIELCPTADPVRLRLQILAGAFLVADARLGWSRQPGWQRLNGWSRATLAPWRPSARNEAPAAYAAESGRRSPAWDVATFAASWIAERAAAPSDADPPLTCRLLPQARFLHARLRELSDLPPWLREPPRCRAFERWADREHLEAIEIGLATPSTVTMASMFGHVFLRLVRRAPAGHAPLADRTLAFLVENALPVTEERLYAWKGIVGAYAATLVERSLLETYRTYVVTEGRDLRRFRLELSPRETDDLLARLWSVEQAGRYRYTFFGANCATLMVDLVDSVLPDDRQIRYPQALATTPAGTLEGFAEARSETGAPLATFIPETILSFEHEARRAAAARERVARGWRQAVLPDERARLGSLLRELERGDEQERAAAYRALLGDGRRARPGAQLFVRQSLIVESHLSTLANLEAEQARFRLQRERLRTAIDGLRGRLRAALSASPGCAGTLAAATETLAGEETAARAHGYRELRALLDGPCALEAGVSEDLRRLALLESELHFDADLIAGELGDALLFPAPDRALGEQAFAAGLVDLIDYPYVTRVSAPLLVLQQAKVALAQARELRESPEAMRRADLAEQHEEEAAAYTSAVPRTGIDELEAGAGVDGGGAGAQLVLGGAMHDERIGDQRRFGFAAHTALAVMRTRMAVAWRDGRPRVGTWNARVVEYRSLRPSLAPARVGGELFVDTGDRPALARGLEVRVGGGGLLPLLASASLADHLLASVGAVAAFDRPGAGADRRRADVWGLGAAAGLEGRLGLSRDHQGAWVAARASVRPLWTTDGRAGELLAVGELRLPLAERVRLVPGAAGRGLSLRLSATLFASTLRYARSAPGFDRQLAVTLACE